MDLYTVKANDTIEAISNVTNRGICDIARLNRMAERIPPAPHRRRPPHLPPLEACNQDDTSCLITSQPNATYLDCALDRPHTYYTVKGDTNRYIALKLNIIVAALSATAQGGVTDPDALVEVDNFLKLPQCSPSVCNIVDRVGLTIGQIMALNLTYNRTDVARGEGAVVTVPENCRLLEGDVSVVS
ncbi:uncharacterized protein BO97DRAFT_431474 [Aspergillus homomorphus CBS 101889]|uniref:LysM domain-containing protein n=1 Tax=Aspergillus homomorphus (strain CBS 101889) TaxID=1450537 RepID=A0A395IA04_ASPHC|nr:hypothetical protein BO97DRAFT_431474 [Aspergillus homomorphus CBS 101889]RAL16629.1 hypothetical protein BO97DRAFT_431474 [Aspergillus homomorphus CBS 101889]